MDSDIPFLPLKSTCQMQKLLEFHWSPEVLLSEGVEIPGVARNLSGVITQIAKKISTRGSSLDVTSHLNTRLLTRIYK